MAFVRKKVNSYPWPVVVKRPSEKNPGEFESAEFVITFKRLSQTQLNDFQESSDQKKALLEIVLGWSEILEEDGTEVPFSKATLREFSEDVDFITAVFKAYGQFYQGGIEGN